MKSATEVSAASMSAKRQKIKHDDDEKEDPSPLPPSIADAPWKPENPVSFESLTVSDKTMWNNIKADIQALKSTYGQMNKTKAVRTVRSIINDKKSLCAAVEKLLLKIEQNPTMITVHSMHNPCLLHTFALSGVLSLCPLEFKVETLKKLIAKNPSALLWSDRHYEKCSFMKELLFMHPEISSSILENLPQLFSSDDEELQGLACFISLRVAGTGSSEEIVDFFTAYPQGLSKTSDDGILPLNTIMIRTDYDPSMDRERRFDPDGLAEGLGWDPNGLATVLMDLIEMFPSSFHEGLPPSLKDSCQAELCKIFFHCTQHHAHRGEAYRNKCFKLANLFLQRAPRKVLENTLFLTTTLKDLAVCSRHCDMSFDFMVTFLRVIRAYDQNVDPSDVRNNARLVSLVDEEVVVAKECIPLRLVHKMVSKETAGAIDPALKEALKGWTSKRLDAKFSSLERVKSIRNAIEEVRTSIQR